MTKKKSKITNLVLKNNVPSYVASCFRVGAIPTDRTNTVVETMPEVKSISFARHAYGQGAVVDEPCYFVTFNNSNEILIIAASERGQVIISVDNEEAGHTPPLPE